MQALEHSNTVDMTKSVKELLNELTQADNKVKCEIENEMVKMGEAIVPELVSQIQVIRGSVRGVVAMTLIRIGQPAVSFINKAASENKDFQWIANYLISEICGRKAA